MDEQSNVNMDSTPNRGSSGPVIAIVVILVIIILGGFYFWSERVEDEDMMTDKTMESINLQSGEDDTASIEADLNATKVENIDAQLNAQ